MIGHVILFKLREPIEESKTAVISELESLGDGRIPAVIVLTMHANIVSTPTSWDLLLLASITDERGLQDYLEHPDHIGASERIRPYVIDAAAIDYAAG